MKKTLTLTAVLALCSLWSAAAAIIPKATPTTPYKSCYERVTDALHQRQARRAAKAGIMAAATDGAIKLDGADGATTFGWLSRPDGVEWYYAAEIYRTELPQADTKASYTDVTISGFKLSVYDENYQIGCRSIEDHKRIYSVMRQNKNAFMKLFSLFYFDLWD